MNIALILAITSFLSVAAFLDVRARHDVALTKRPRTTSSYVGLLAGVYKSSRRGELVITLTDASVVTESSRDCVLLDVAIDQGAQLTVLTPDTDAMLNYCSTWVAHATPVRIDKVSAGNRLLFFSIIDADGRGLASAGAKQFLAL
jgi:hypothetical protein